VNVERSSKDYKYVNCFLLVVKLVDRLQVMESINVLIHMFGVEVLKSLILVINMTPDAQKINSLDSLKKNVPNFADIKKLYSGFDLDKQVYWNYFFDLDRKVLKDWWVMYGKHRAELLSRILKLHRYDSVHYNKYLETIKEKEKQQLLNQEERNKAIEEKIKK
jgi:hypothetical protein